MLTLLGALTVAGAATAAPEPTALERIRATGVITVCADPDNLPISAKSPEPSGYDVEIAQEIARSLGVRLAYHWFATNYARRAFRQVVEGRCDYIMGLPARIDFEEADARMVLSQPYYTTGFVPAVRADLPVNSYDDLKGYEVGVAIMTVADFVLFREGITRHLYQGQQDLFAALASGEITAAVMWGPSGGWYIKSHPEAKLRMVAESRPKMTFSLAVGVRKADADLREAIDRSLDALKSSGRIDAILQRYGVPQLAPAAAQPAPAQAGSDRR
ncbi:substrate-binding periplasmic protein [Ralstonia soli]|uniref:Transporter substrate-binding domain-containing protein n=1 Tax=Ralstonia soli TaxID=2953896 RepID=A0ABT1ATJ4_9RALS|nr:transporter substrate-binding domain-containing protein [Ralstonia soli]MCO5401715.1 transporter substrate-binding domain-containing protein [Ralstonia soli]